MPDATILDVVVAREALYYSLHPIYVLSGYGIVALEFVLAHFVLLATGNRIPGSFLTMSKNVMHIYIVQWLATAIVSPLLASISSIWLNIAIAFSVLVISYFGGMQLKKSNLIRA